MEENNDGDEGRWGEGLPSDRKNEGEEYSHSPFLPKSSKTLWGDSDYNYPPITPAFRAQGGNKHMFLTGMAPFPTEQIDGGAGNVGPLWAPATLFLYRRRSRGSSKGVDVGMCHIREAIICSKALHGACAEAHSLLAPKKRRKSVQPRSGPSSQQPGSTSTHGTQG